MMRNFHQKLKFVKHAFGQSLHLLSKSFSSEYPKILGTDFTSHDKSKKQILIIGYYGASNYGDELMLKILLDRLQNDSTEISVVFSKDYDYAYSQWENTFPYFSPKNTSDLEKAADFFDEVIVGGGAHIDDRNRKNLSFTPKLIIELTKLMIKRNKTIRWLGVSASREISRRAYIDDLKLLVPQLTECTVRDSNSIDTLKQIGIPTDNIQLVDDIAFEIGDSTKIICVTLLDFCQEPEKMVEVIKDIVTFARQAEEKWKICFLPFFNKNHTDYASLSSTIRNIDFGDIEYFIAPEYSNINSMLMMIKGCDLFVNMRYHASLISLLHNKPTISLVYDRHPHYFNKMTYLHRRFKKEDCVILFKDYTKGAVLQKLNEIHP